MKEYWFAFKRGFHMKTSRTTVYKHEPFELAARAKPGVVNTDKNTIHVV